MRYGLQMSQRANLFHAWNSDVREIPISTAEAILARTAECLGGTHPHPSLEGGESKAAEPDVRNGSRAFSTNSSGANGWKAATNHLQQPALFSEPGVSKHMAASSALRVSDFETAINGFVFAISA